MLIVQNLRYTKIHIMKSNPPSPIFSFLYYPFLVYPFRDSLYMYKYTHIHTHRPIWQNTGQVDMYALCNYTICISYIVYFCIVYSTYSSLLCFLYLTMYLGTSFQYKYACLILFNGCIIFGFIDVQKVQ